MIPDRPDTAPDGAPENGSLVWRESDVVKHDTGHWTDLDRKARRLSDTLRDAERMSGEIAETMSQLQANGWAARPSRNAKRWNRLITKVRIDVERGFVQ